VQLIRPAGGEIAGDTVYPCFEHETMADLLPPTITWRYYAPKPVSSTAPAASFIWTAPASIQHLCQSTGPGGDCNAPNWSNNVHLKPTDVWGDIDNCTLQSVSWVIPDGNNSDHAGSLLATGGPSWVASIVNKIGSGSCGYWKDTAIFVTWDDWGGWYDHEPPTILPKEQGDYQYGFRVPLLVVSAYTPAHYINNARHDFGSILRFIQQNFGIQEGSLNFADARAMTDLTAFFTGQFRSFQPIQTSLSTEFFLNDKRPARDPDDD
jgi:phospholipase C